LQTPCLRPPGMCRPNDIRPRKILRPCCGFVLSGFGALPSELGITGSPTGVCMYSSLAGASHSEVTLATSSSGKAHVQTVSVQSPHFTMATHKCDEAKMRMLNACYNFQGHTLSAKFTAIQAISQIHAARWMQASTR